MSFHAKFEDAMDFQEVVSPWLKEFSINECR